MFGSKLIRHLAVALYLGMALLLGQCVPAEKEQPSGSGTGVTGASRVLIVNEGLFNRNNSTLTLFNLRDSSTTTDVYEQSTGQRLGDTGNDIALYGQQIFVLVNVSSRVVVLNKNTLSIRYTIPLFKAGNVPHQPRQVAFWGGKAFVSCFSNTVVVIDTATGTVVKEISTGRNPEGIICTGGKVAVACSGGLSAPNFDNRVFIYDATTYAALDTITVAANPTTLVPATANKAWVYAKADFTSPTASLQLLNLNSGVVERTETIGSAMLYSTDSLLYRFETRTRQLITRKHSAVQETTISQQDLNRATTPYGLLVLPDGRFIITDARDYTTTGRMLLYNASGQLLLEKPTGLNPGAMVWLP